MSILADCAASASCRSTGAACALIETEVSEESVRWRAVTSRMRCPEYLTETWTPPYCVCTSGPSTTLGSAAGAPVVLGRECGGGGAPAGRAVAEPARGDVAAEVGGTAPVAPSTGPAGCSPDCQAAPTAAALASVRMTAVAALT